MNRKKKRESAVEEGLLSKECRIIVKGHVDENGSARCFLESSHWDS